MEQRNPRGKQFIMTTIFSISRGRAARVAIHAACIAVLVAGVLLAGCGPAGDEPELDLAAAEADVRAKEARAGKLEDMQRVLDLDPATGEALQAAFAAGDEAVEDWIAGERGQQLIELEARMFAAVDARDLAEVRRTTAAAKPLRDELRALLADHEQAILDVLTPEQQVEWHGHEVSRKLLDLLKPLNLGFEQAQAIERSGAPAVSQAIDRGEPNPKAAAFLDLEKWVEDSVLDPEQRAAYQDIKSENKLRSLGI